nr:protein argonaute 18-like [Aegilops tauschii subsp. strangulata]
MGRTGLRRVTEEAAAGVGMKGSGPVGTDGRGRSRSRAARGRGVQAVVDEGARERGHARAGRGGGNGAGDRKGKGGTGAHCGMQGSGQWARGGGRRRGGVRVAGDECGETTGSMARRRNDGLGTGRGGGRGTRGDGGVGGDLRQRWSATGSPGGGGIEAVSAGALPIQIAQGGRGKGVAPPIQKRGGEREEWGRVGWLGFLGSGG